ncbi:putative ABC transport system ATP-binding protein [Skermanella aerolata]|uniref:ABC transporter ATP-binding protein n=1 Tax=Skermanella aerolata TaxID=393310 RepID=UPI003D1A91F8
MNAPAPVLDIVDLVHERGSGSGRFRLVIERLALAASDQVALVGQSGCGKSTALDMMAFVLRPSSGVRFMLHAGGTGSDIMALWRSGARDRLTRLRAAGTGYVLQTGGLVPFLSVAENVLLTRRLLGLPCPGPTPALLAELGIGELVRRLPRQVSIGERQRVAIARALAHRPALILADEPTASLDPPTGETTMSLLTNVARHHEAALIVVTHDRDLAERHGLTVVECQPEPAGTVIRFGTDAA